MSLYAAHTETKPPVSYKWTIVVPSLNNARLELTEKYMTQSSLVLDANKTNLPVDSDLEVSLTITGIDGSSSAATKTIRIVDDSVPKVTIQAGNLLTVSQDAFVLVVGAEHSSLYDLSWGVGSLEFMWLCTGDNCDNIDGLTDYWTITSHLAIPAGAFAEGSSHTLTVRVRYGIHGHDAYGEDRIDVVSQVYLPTSCISLDSSFIMAGEEVCATSCSTYYDSLEWNVPDTLVEMAAVAGNGESVCLNTAGMDVGAFDICLTATRSLDGTASSTSCATINVTETAAVDCSITVTPEVTFASSQITLHGHCVSPSGDSITYAWQQTSGPTLSLDDPRVLLSTSTATPHLVLGAGALQEVFEYSFELSCTDTLGASGSATTTVCPTLSPSGGYLTVSSYEVAATESLIVTAIDWIVPEGNGPLKYSFTYSDVDSEATTLLASSEYKSSCDLFLPEGFYSLGVRVTDTEGATVSYTDSASVTVSIDTEMDTYADSMKVHFKAAVVAADISKALNVLDVLCQSASANEYELSSNDMTLYTNYITDTLDDILSLPGGRSITTQIVGALSQMANAPLDYYSSIVARLAESGSLENMEVVSVVTATTAVYSDAHDSVWSDDISSQRSALSAAQAFGAVQQMAASVAAGLVEGQRPVSIETDHIQLSAQALTTQSVEQEVGVPGSDMTITLPATFRDHMGYDSDLSVAVVSLPEPFMGDNSTSFYSAMTSVEVIDTSGTEVSVADLAAPVTIKIPLTSLPDPEMSAALNATLLLKAWNGSEWTESGITTQTYNPDLGYILAETDHFTSFVAFFHQYGIDVNVIDIEEIPDLLTTVEDNPMGLYILGVCFSVYVGLMIVLSFDNLQNGMATFFRSQVFKSADSKAGVGNETLESYVTAQSPGCDTAGGQTAGDAEWEFMQAGKPTTGSTNKPASCVSVHSVVFTPLDVPPSPGTLSVTDVDIGEISEDDTEDGNRESDESGVIRCPWTDQPVVLSAVSHTPFNSAESKSKPTAATTASFPLDLQELRTERRIKAKMQRCQDGEAVTFWQRFRSKLKQDLYTGHEWTGLVFNKTREDSNMTGPRRVTNIFVFVFGLFLTSAMFFRADCEPGVARPGEEGLLVSEVVCVPYTYKQTFLIACGTTIIALPPSMLLRYLFSHTRPIGKHKDNALKKRFPPRDRNWLYRTILSLSLVDLPYGFAYLWYALSFIYLLGVGFMMLLYSMKFASSVGRAWLLANIIGVIQDAVVNDPIKIVVQTLLSLTLGTIEVLPGIVNLLLDLGFV
ncbi:hypothetical protein KIPB_002877 [Kipferlia bialata]|uniref:PKD/REJ-like domain-containing protein n=1 Tax=Kipferlia bialata TaxID=797122 RepID=A0A391NJQ5_9EUKA|nr:hypothetical protein KIPB_002877 [Kipferlia bialata]|eukprot:g2877.t1